MAGVKDDIPAGERWGGIIAKPTKAWFREVLALRRLAGTEVKPAAGSKDEGSD